MSLTARPIFRFPHRRRQGYFFASFTEAAGRLLFTLALVCSLVAPGAFASPAVKTTSGPGDVAADAESVGPDAASAPGLGERLLELWQRKLGTSSPSALRVTPYGMIVTNAIWNSGAVAPTLDAPIIAKRGSLLDEEMPGQGSFVLTARQSRAGLQVGYAWPQGIHADATIEFDLWGLHETEGPGTITQTSLRLRHAFVRITDGRFRLLAGQSWSVVTPRLPTSLGHMAVALHSMSGVIWNRLPQLTLEVEQPLVGDWFAVFRGSLTRPHSADGEIGLTRFETPEPGLMSQLPWAQGRISLHSEHVEVGFAGHVGKERFEVAKGTETQPGYRYGELRFDSVDVTTWLASFDFRFHADAFWLNGQLWTGENVNGMFGLHGVYAERWGQEDLFANGALAGLRRDVVPLAATGGWAEAGLHLGQTGWRALVSGAFETGPREAVGYGALHRNMSAFGALVYQIFEPLDASIEYLHTFSFYRPNWPEREFPGYRPDQDLLFGGEPPTRETMGHNGSLSLNFRLRF